MPLIDFSLSLSTKLTAHMTPDQFVDAMTAMDGGDTVAYAVGDVSLDVAGSPMLAELRKVVWTHYVAGRGHLTQCRRTDLPKRQGGYIYEYRFTKASPRRGATTAAEAKAPPEASVTVASPVKPWAETAEVQPS